MFGRDQRDEYRETPAEDYVFAIFAVLFLLIVYALFV